MEKQKYKHKLQDGGYIGEEEKGKIRKIQTGRCTNINHFSS